MEKKFSLFFLVRPNLLELHFRGKKICWDQSLFGLAFLFCGLESKSETFFFLGWTDIVWGWYEAATVLYMFLHNKLLAVVLN